MQPLPMLTLAVLAGVTSLSAPVATAGRAWLVTGGIATHAVARGETLGSISARFGIDVAALAADNGLRPNAVLPAGHLLRVDNRHLVPAGAGDGITINVPQRMLFYAWEGVVTGLPVAVGKGSWPTPTQPFTIIRKETDPTWDVPESIREEARRAGRELPRTVPPGPANPLGQYWLGLSIPGVGIHGTNAPASIYRVTTHGCIRVGPDGIAWLFPRVAVGTRGQIIYEPIMLAVVDDDVVLEVHADVYRRLGAAPRDVVRMLARRAGLSDDIDWTLVEGVLAARHGVPRTVRWRAR
jgi:L,D-transpeptidase ErfK/SrfK